MTRLTPSLLISALLLSGCGGIGSGDSGWNPLGWFSGGGSSKTETLEPEDGYVQKSDIRPGIPQILSAKWEPITEGRLLVVTGLAPTKGYHSAELIAARPHPGGRLAPDADGVLRLRFVALPPLSDSTAARLPANPAVDSITVAMAISSVQLAGVTKIEIAGASNVVTLSQ